MAEKHSSAAVKSALSKVKQLNKNSDFEKVAAEKEDAKLLTSEEINEKDKKIVQ